ncbi:probable oligoribonuclease [Condylostylus longicornis]|uniref:probable oligoribonuclease n=1 Tax=Condylostylus longicornis TaxID=2530218 RepID=UPI00244E54F2|nr:probable oligoribonuclease [Condylostylus longicornis]
MDHIVWIDLELTGLEIEKHKIVEISCLITDKQLNIIAEGPLQCIHQSEGDLKKMNDWCKEHFQKNGLLEACKNSTTRVEEAEKTLLAFLQQHIPKKVCPLAGNSVYMDRLFIMKYLPNLNEYLHYRIIDVSTIKELCRRWNPEIYKQAPKKKLAHRSLDDIKETIEELKYYKENLINVKL